jgi:hypothetical protein
MKFLFTLAKENINMNNVLQTLKLDIYTVKTAYSKIFMIYIISIFIGLQTQSIVPIFMIMFISVSFSGFPFSIFEKNNCDSLYGILPIHRKEIVIGRYFFAIVSGILNLIISLILSFIATLLTKQGIDIFILFLSIALTFCYYCFAVGISYPIYYRFGFSRSFIWTVLPMYLLLLFIIFIAQRTNIAEIFDKALQYYANHNILLLFSGFILGIIMLIVSCFISYKIFKNKDL